MNEKLIITFMRVGGKIISYVGLGAFTASLIIDSTSLAIGGMIGMVFGCFIHEVGEMID